MKISKILLAIIIVSIFSCKDRRNNSVEQTEQIEKEIQQLKEANARKIYLEKILEDDQEKRNSEESTKLISTYGLDSPEYLKYIEAQWKQDEINLQKIEKYLEIHGYPNKQLGEMATTAPWMVIHHAQGYHVRERNFEIIYKAYLKGDIDGNAISFYLGRMYEMKNGQRLKMKSPYKISDEINQLIIGLDLEEKKMLVKKQIEKNTQDNNNYMQ